MQRYCEVVYGENYYKSSVSGNDLSGVRIIELFDTFNLGASFFQEGGICDEEGFMAGAEFNKELVHKGLDLG